MASLERPDSSSASHQPKYLNLNDDLIADLLCKIPC